MEELPKATLLAACLPQATISHRGKPHQTYCNKDAALHTRAALFLTSQPLQIPLQTHTPPKTLQMKPQQARQLGWTSLAFAGCSQRPQEEWGSAIPAQHQETMVGADAASAFRADETFPELSLQSRHSCPKSTAEPLCEQHHSHK